MDQDLVPDERITHQGVTALLLDRLGWKVTVEVMPALLLPLQYKWRVRDVVQYLIGLVAAQRTAR